MSKAVEGHMQSCNRPPTHPYWSTVKNPIALYYNIVPLTIHRCPDDSKIGDKMIYASTKDSLKKAFSGLSLEFQANDRGDFDYDTYAAEVEKKA